MFKNINLTNKSSTYFPALLKTFLLTKGIVIEFGSGVYSTPLIHWLCYNKRKAITYENFNHYYSFAKKFENKYHKIIFVKDWDKIDLNDKYSIALIDHSPKKPRTRGMEAIKLKDNTEYVILHDSEDEIKYGYDKAWEHFKYRFDYTIGGVKTTVLSNFVDLSSFKI